MYSLIVGSPILKLLKKNPAIKNKRNGMKCNRWMSLVFSFCSVREVYKKKAGGRANHINGKNRNLKLPG